MSKLVVKFNDGVVRSPHSIEDEIFIVYLRINEFVFLICSVNVIVMVVVVSIWMLNHWGETIWRLSWCSMCVPTKLSHCNPVNLILSTQDL